MNTTLETNNVWLWSTSQDPYFNLAAEEYLIRHFNTEQTNLLFIYTNQPCIVVGKHQNIFEEIHWSTLTENNFPIVRRVSGGGTVYHDAGNINFTFIEKCLPGKVNQYQSSTGLLVKALNELNIPCYLDARNAIRLNNEHKISGSAQFTNQKNILSHCTLLLESDLTVLKKVLQINPFKIESKSSKSVRSEVEKLSTQFQSIIQPTQSFISKLTHTMGYHKPFQWTQSDLESIETLKQEKYNTAAWNLHKSANGSIYLPQGMVTIDEGIIQTCSFDKSLEQLFFIDCLNDLMQDL